MTDPAIFTIATDLLICIEGRLAATTAGIPARSFVTAGQLAWDSCDCDGQLTIGFTRSFLSNTFPQPVAVNVPCGAAYEVWALTATVLRCAPGPVSPQQPFPDPGDLQSSALRQVTDGIAIRSGLLCCLGEMSTRQVDRTKRIEEWTAGVVSLLGPAGGCAGVSMDVTVGLRADCPC